MQTTITSPHFELTEALEQAVLTQSSKISSHAIEGNHIRVILDNGGPGRHRAHVSVRGMAHPIEATASHQDMYTAIDKVFSLIDRQWRKRKTAHLSSRSKSSLRNRLG